jgi:hypothetical protein
MLAKVVVEPQATPKANLQNGGGRTIPMTLGSSSATFKGQVKKIK